MAARSSYLRAQDARVDAPSAQMTAARLVTVRGDTQPLFARDTVTVVAVFATWCRGCREEVATLNALQREFASAAVRLLAISADEGSTGRLTQWLAVNAARYPVVHDTLHVVARALGVVGVPELFVLNGDGRIAWHHRGPLGDGLPALRTALQTALRTALQHALPRRSGDAKPVR